MEPLNSSPETKYTVAVNGIDRWQVYHRLQELSIPCECSSNQPLEVEICSTVAAVQLWSVSRQLTASRQDLIWMLNRCWQLSF